MRELDERGLPGVSVITTAFVDAFEQQADSMGFEGARVVVEHPVQNRTTEELHAMADDAFPAILAALVS